MATEPKAVVLASVCLGIGGAIVKHVGKGAAEEEGMLRIRKGAEYEGVREREEERERGAFSRAGLGPLAESP